MKFKRVKFNPGSWALGVHYGRNPVNGQRFLCIMPLPMITIDFGEDVCPVCGEVRNDSLQHYPWQRCQKAE